MKLVYKFIYIMSNKIEGSTGFYMLGKRVPERERVEGTMNFVKLMCEKKGYRT